MHDDAYALIGERLRHFQAALEEDGGSLREYIDQHYVHRWRSDALHRVMRIRTSLVAGMQDHLVDAGLLNLERVQLSLVTDPLNHDVEHTPTIDYRGQPYVTTHSMIYSKFLACHGPAVPGVFVDSPNIRLEIASPEGRQRGRYLIDFSQLDVEVRCDRGIDLDTYYDRPDHVAAVLHDDRDAAIRFFEETFRAGLRRVLDRNSDDLRAIGVAIELPDQPFPAFDLDDARERHGRRDLERKLGEETDSPFFWVRGLLRENYDLVYPYLARDGSRPDPSAIPSRDIYNYDLCVKSVIRSSGAATPAVEVLSGALREWLAEPIIARLLDNRVIPEPPVFRNGSILNIEELGGYGPFLMVAARTDDDGTRTFPETFGGGIGIERALWALLRGPAVRYIEDVTCFGKNPDSQPLYLF